VIRDINPGQYVNNLRFADDVDLLEKDRDRLQSSLVDDSRAGEMGLSLYKDVNKTKTMVSWTTIHRHSYSLARWKLKTFTNLCIWAA